jgi:hypothetical protein
MNVLFALFRLIPGIDMPTKLTLANLLPHDGPVTMAMTRLLKVLVIPGGPHEGLAVREAVRNRRVLTSVRFEEIQVDLAKSIHNELRLAPDSPFLTAQHRSKLDALGVVRTGERVKAGDVLVGLVAVARTRQPTKAGMQWVRDASRTVPPGWDGAIVESSLRLSSRLDDGSDECLAAGQVKVELRVEHDLAIGDVLSVRERVLGIVARFVPDDETPRRDGVAADIVVPLATAEPLGLMEGMHELEIGKADDLGQFNVQARADGPHSLITQQPLRGSRDAGLASGGLPRSCRITTAHVGWLRQRGLNAILSELVSLKSDDWQNRAAVHRLREADAPPADYPRPGTPHALYLVRAELMALGLHVECRGDEYVTLSLRPATRDELLSASHGAIARPETIHYRTLEEIPDGLLCPKVFGHDYRFGHIALPAPIVPYLWRIGSPSALESMLGFSRGQIESLVNYQMRVRHCGDGFEWRGAADALPVEDGEGSWLTGADAIRALLAEVRAEELPPTAFGHASVFVQDLILVPPVLLRPLVLLENGNFATADVNDLYRRLINRANRLAKLRQLNAPEVILRNEGRMLQQCADTLFANCLMRKKVLGSRNKPLVDLLDLAINRVIQTSEKRVDWGGRARVVVEPALAEGEVVVPHTIFDALRLTPGRPVLCTSPEEESFAAAWPRSGPDALIRLSPAAFAALGLEKLDVPLCELHVPLGAAAVEETRQLLRQPREGNVQLGSDPFVDAQDFDEGLDRLVEAALTGRPIHFSSPRGLLLAGTGNAKFREEMPHDKGTEADDAREIPEPTSAG